MRDMARLATQTSEMRLPATNRFRRRILWRSAVAVVAVFLVMAIVSVWVIQSIGQRSAETSTQNALDTVAGNVEKEMADTVADWTLISTGSIVRTFARQADETPNVSRIGTRLRERQEEILRLFEYFVSSNADYVRSVRYIASDANSWGTVMIRSGDTVPVVMESVTIQTYLLDTNDQTWSTVLAAEPGTPFWSSITQIAGIETTIYVYIPVTSLGSVADVLGAVQMQVTLTRFIQNLNDALDQPAVQQEGRRIVLLDSLNRVLVDTGGTGEELPEAVIEEEAVSYIRLRAGDWAISSTPIKGFVGEAMPWRVVLIDDAGVAIAPYQTAALVVVALYGLALVAVLIGLYHASRAIARPLANVNLLAGHLASGRMFDKESVLTPDLLTEDELGDLTRSLGEISDRLVDLTGSLETRVQKRTRELEVAARIGREVATLYNIESLLSRTVNLICDEFSFYHAQVFLVDDVEMNAVLVQSRGKAGQQLLEQNFKIPVGSTSVIGTVTGQGIPVIVNDTAREDTPHRFNPILAETRAEIGLPLFSGNTVIGALDIQSREPNTFHEDDIPTLTLLADQLAVAIANARLMNQAEQRIQQIDRLNRQLTRTAWEEFGQGGEIVGGFQYNLMDVEQSDAETTPEPGSLSAAISVRNEVIGELFAAPIEGQEFTSGDRAVLQAVANRVSLAIENARLFQETQSTLMETATLYQMSRYLNEANTLEDIVRAVIVSVVPDAGGGQIWLYDEYYEYDAPRWVTLVTDLALAEREENSTDLSGLRLQIPDHRFLGELQPNQVTLINDVRQDARLDTGLRLTLRRLGAQSAVFIPITVRAVWRGFITLPFDKPRQFGEREGRVYSALTDQAGVAIDNRLLLQQTEEEVARNENLYAASRIINTAQTMQDLVYAAVATSRNPDLSFSLSLLEGQLDATGWPARAHMVAQSKGGIVEQVDYHYPFTVPPESALRNREPELVVDDTPNVPSASERITWMREQNWRFLVTYPLYGANQPVALFHISSQRKIHELSASDYEVYRALAGQMSSQIQIRNLLQRTEAALDEARRLYVASSAITSAPDTDAVYQVTIEHLARPFLPIQMNAQAVQTIDMALLMAWPDPSPEAAYLECVYRWKSDTGNVAGYASGERVSATHYPFGQLTNRIAQPLYIKEITEEAPEDTPLAQEPQFHAVLLKEEVASLVAAPIQVRDMWFGVIVSQSNHPDAFDEQYLRFLMAIADQVAIAVDNKRLFEEARYEAERAQMEAQRALALAEAAQLTNRIGGAAGDITRSLDQVFERVAEQGGFDRWMLLLYDDDNITLIPTTIRAKAGRAESMRLYSVSMPLPIMQAIRTNRLQIVNDPTGYLTEKAAHDPELKSLDVFFGKHVAAPVAARGRMFGGLFMGRSLEARDLREADAQLIETLATQVALALENRRLFQQVQSEQQTLRSILETLPAGVLVLNPDTLTPIQFNEQVQTYLGRKIDPAEPFSVETYNLCRTGTSLPYPADEMPIFTALQSGQLEFKDDIAVVRENDSVDLMVNAAPITDARGGVTAIVAAFQDITNLRQLENTLQENLRETVALYEAQRQLTEAVTLDDVLDVIITQLILLQPSDAFILTRDEEGQIDVARHFIQPPGNPEPLTELLKPREVVHIPNLEETTLGEETRTVLATLGAQSLLAIPLHVSIYNAPYGWMVAYSDRPDGFLPEQVRVFGQLGEVTSTAVDNRLLMLRQQETVREVRSLYNASNAISRARDVEQLTIGLQTSLAAMDPDYLAGYLFSNAGLSPDTMELFNRAGDGLNRLDFETLLQGYPIPMQGIYVDDLRELDDPPPALARLLKAGVGAMAAISLRPRDTDSGFLIVAYYEPHHFTESEERYLTTLADGASVVFNNFILFAQIQSALEETSTLYQASRALSDATTPDEVLSVVVNYFASKEVDRAFIALLETRSWEIEGAAAYVAADWNASGGRPMHGNRLSRRNFPAWEHLASREVLTISDIYQMDTIAPEKQAEIAHFGACSIVVIPLRVPARAIGAIWLSAPEPYQYEPRDERTYRAFAEQASLSMEAAYLFQQTEHRARQLETSAEVSQSVGQILDLEALLSRVVDLIKAAFNYDHVQVFLMDEHDEYAELRASTGEAGQKLLAIKHKLRKGSDSVIGQVAAKGEPQVALDTADAQVVHRPNPYLPLTRSEMGLPLILKERVVGALDVQSNQPSAFGEEDVRALTTLAAQIAVAIDNANLYEAAQEQADRMGFLFQITSAAATAETVEEALQTVCGRIYHMLNVLSVVAYLPQMYVDNLGNTFTTLKPVVLVGSSQPITEIEEVRLDDPDKLLSEVSRNRQPFVIDDVAAEGGYLPIVSSARSAVLLPMVAGGQTIGMILLEDERPGAFGYDALQLLLTLSGSLSAVVQSLRLLEELTKTNEQLRELDRMKSNFLANMSHELRTPLNSIIGFSRVMLKGIDGELTEMQEQDLTTIYNSGQHLLMLINDVLDQAKIAASKMELKFGYFDVKPLIEGVRSIGIGLVKDKSVNMLMEVASNLPQAYGDELRTRQVLINLISNAAKFTNDGSITIRVYTVSEEYTGATMIRIDVADTGIGIADKDIPLLFEAFRQIDSSLTRTAGGTGLGLPIAKSLVELQGGQMMVETQVNAGSTFSITIPVEPVNQPEEVEEPEADEELEAALDGETLFHPPRPSEPDRQSKTDATVPTRPPTQPSRKMMQAKREILLIEDNKDMVDQFRRILQREGFDVVTADHPAYAEAMVSNMQPTVLVMDVNFGNGEGWNILHRLQERDDTFDIPVVIVTLSDEAERAFELGAHSFIPRPFMPEELVEAVLAAEKESNTERILIIDDQPEDIRLLTQLLNNNGKYRIYAAQTGAEGISLIARRRPDLIILDLRMPEMDGFAVLQELRSNPEIANIPVLVVTGEVNFTADEQQQLHNLHVLYKTDISQEQYDRFIQDVRKQLEADRSI